MTVRPQLATHAARQQLASPGNKANGNNHNKLSKQQKKIQNLGKINGWKHLTLINTTFDYFQKQAIMKVKRHKKVTDKPLILNQLRQKIGPLIKLGQK